MSAILPLATSRLPRRLPIPLIPKIATANKYLFLLFSFVLSTLSFILTSNYIITSFSDIYT